MSNLAVSFFRPSFLPPQTPANTFAFGWSDSLGFICHVVDTRNAAKIRARDENCFGIWQPKGTRAMERKQYRGFQLSVIHGVYTGSIVCAGRGFTLAGANPTQLCQRIDAHWARLGKAQPQAAETTHD